MKDEKQKILETFKDFTSGIRVFFLILRHRDGGASNNTKVRKIITSSPEEFEKAVESLLKEKEKNPLFRIYCSVNARDFKKAVRQFKFEILESDDYDEKSRRSFYFGIKDRFIGCLSQPRAQADSNFLIDVDNPARMEEAESCLKSLSVEILLKYRTKSGFHIITKPFNPNLFKVEDCEVKKNALMLLSY